MPDIQETARYYYASATSSYANMLITALIVLIVLLVVMQFSDLVKGAKNSLPWKEAQPASPAPLMLPLSAPQ